MASHVRSNDSRWRQAPSWACLLSRPIPSHPIPSHPIVSHPIPGWPRRGCPCPAAHGPSAEVLVRRPPDPFLIHIPGSCRNQNSLLFAVIIIFAFALPALFVNCMEIRMIQLQSRAEMLGSGHLLVLLPRPVVARDEQSFNIH